MWAGSITASNDAESKVGAGTQGRIACSGQRIDSCNFDVIARGWPTGSKEDGNWLMRSSRIG